MLVIEEFELVYDGTGFQVEHGSRRGAFECDDDVTAGLVGVGPTHPDSLTVRIVRNLKINDYARLIAKRN